MKALFVLLNAAFSALNFTFYFTDGHHWWSLFAGVFSAIGSVALAASN